MDALTEVIREKEVARLGFRVQGEGWVLDIE